MPLYAYKATSPNGTRHTGFRFGASPDDIYTSLKLEKLMLTDCKETKAERFLPRVSSRFSTLFFHGISRTLLIDFCHDMAQLDDARVPLHNALEDLALSSPHRGFRTLLQLIHEDVKMGIPLSESLARYPVVFDRVFQKLIAAAEQTGSYAQQFRHLESHLRRLESMNHQIQKAIRSPLILIGLLIALLLVVIDFVIPNMSSLLSSIGLKELPLSTRLLLGVSPILAYIPLGLFIIFLSLSLAYSFSTTRYYLAKFAARLPLYDQIALTQFWHAFSVMIGAGIDLLPSLAQSVQVIRNPYLRDHLTALSGEITAGAKLSDAFSQEKNLISPIVLRFIKLSEQTGHLKELIPQAASHHQSQTYRKMESLVSWLEPTLILLMGGIMVWIVMAIIIPFYGVIGHLT